MLKKYKQRSVKNTFSFVQFKKLIGKKLIIPWKGIIISDDIRQKAKKIKEKIKESAKTSKQKNIILSAMLINGILHIIFGIDILVAIMGISYTEIKKYNIDSNVEVIQYPKIPKLDIQKLLE
jgi:uncharacterized protein YqhQ